MQMTYMSITEAEVKIHQYLQHTKRWKVFKINKFLGYPPSASRSHHFHTLTFQVTLAGKASKKNPSILEMTWVPSSHSLSRLGTGRCFHYTQQYRALIKLLVCKKPPVTSNRTLAKLELTKSSICDANEQRFQIT